MLTEKDLSPSRKKRMISEEPIQKVYYQIGEVAQYFNVPKSCIRFWSDTFKLQLKRGHGKSRFRQFTREDFLEMREIYFLLKVEGFTIMGAKRKLGIE